MSKISKIGFWASFPDILGAIRIHGRDGVRIQLDIPEGNILDAIQTIAHRNQAFWVEIDPNITPTKESTNLWDAQRS